MYVSCKNIFVNNLDLLTLICKALLSLTSNMQAICNTQYAICNMQSICNMQAICNIQYAICKQYAICNMQAIKSCSLICKALLLSLLRSQALQASFLISLFSGVLSSILLWNNQNEARGTSVPK